LVAEVPTPAAASFMKAGMPLIEKRGIGQLCALVSFL
jgi:hypothetical protein